MNQKPGPLKKVQSSLALRAVSPQEVRLRPAPIWSQALIWTIIGTASLAFVYAIFAKIDEVILAPGELQPWELSARSRLLLQVWSRIFL